MWIGELFGVICLGAYYQQEALPLISDPKSLIPIYREKIVQCLILGKYTKCAPCTIETLLLYLHLEYNKNEDNQMEIWVLLGVIVRLALRMGYHRDASHFPHISIFQGEMRRRAWAVIISFDALASAQVGLPRMIRESHSDTAEPRNLLDEDLYQEMLTLPPSRPDTVQTLVQFIVAKNTIIGIYGKISDEITATEPISYTEVMRLDKILGDTYSSIPRGLQMRPVSESSVDTPDVILHRISLALLYHKVKCVLHYRHMVPARTDSHFLYSRLACIEASLEILEYQTILDEETQAGRKLYQDRWKISTLIKSTFFLATSLLCREVAKDPTVPPSPREGNDTAIRDRILRALDKAYYVWLKSSDSSREARKAAEVLRVVLGKGQNLNTDESMGMEGSMDHSASAPITDAGIVTKGTVEVLKLVCLHLS
jgi:hypothetical protein